MKWLILIMTFGLLSACNQEQKAERQTPPVTDGSEIPPEIREYLNKQKILCNEGDECHSSVAKVVVLKNQPPVTLTQKLEANFCTGVLVGPDLMLTSATCLGTDVLKKIKKCDEYVYFTFSSRSAGEEVHFKCAKLVDNTAWDKLEIPENALWRNDFALIQLAGTPERQEVKLAVDGIDDIEYYTWKINQKDQFNGKMVREECEHLFNSYMNPFATSAFSPYVPFANCTFNVESEGNTGAPIFNSADELVAIYSRAFPKDRIDSLIRNKRLIKNEIAPLVHATNIGCLKLTSLDVDQSECKKLLELSTLKNLENDLVHGEQNFAEFRQNVKADLETYIKYFDTKVELVFARFQDNPFIFWYELRAIPRCFRDPEKWIDSKPLKNFFLKWLLRKSFPYHYAHPTWKLAIPFDRYLKPQPIVERIDSDVNYLAIFSPYNLKKNGSSDVLLTVPKVAGNSEDLSQRLVDIKACE
ncbi:MAG: trypsin-like serine protease [Bacteriovoracaceae bacterium]|nr:trypsin-like serine protease [Bacteriovoracaceae bacterium]